MLIDETSPSFDSTLECRYFCVVTGSAFPFFMSRMANLYIITNVHITSIIISTKAINTHAQNRASGLSGVENSATGRAVILTTMFRAVTLFLYSNLVLTAK